MNMSLLARLFRFASVASLAVTLTACGGGGSGNSALPNTAGSCSPGTAVQLARPINGQTGVSTTQGSIEIVASGNQNTLGSNYQSFDLILQSPFGGSSISSSNLGIVPDTTGPHPFQSDFFYSGGIPQLSLGTTYTVYLNEPITNCQPVAIGSFST